MDGHIDSGEEDSEEDLEEAEVSDISHLVVLRNWVKEKHENINLLSEVLLEPPAKVFSKVKRIGVYDFTCKQELFF